MGHEVTFGLEVGAGEKESERGRAGCQVGTMVQGG